MESEHQAAPLKEPTMAASDDRRAGLSLPAHGHATSLPGPLTWDSPPAVPCSHGSLQKDDTRC